MPNINKNIIMQAGAAVTNATNKAAGLTAATPEPGSIISAIQLVNGGRTIGPEALAHFAESVRNKLLSLLVNMEPIQDLHGYDHPWPAGGGKNMANPQNDSNPDKSAFSYTVQNQTTISGTKTGDGGRFFARFTAKVESGTNYILSFGTFTIGSTTPGLRIYVYSDELWGTLLAFFTVNETSKSYTWTATETGDLVFGVYTESNATDSVITLSEFMIRIASVSDSTFAPYSNICPISGRTGLDVYAGPTSAIGDATTYSMDWTTPAGTVYAGSADIVTGDIKAAPYYASYNGETLVGPWVSSMDAYDPEGTPTTGAQVVDLGGTMTEYHITGQDIITLVGDNYIWSDSGDVTITE